jgi:CheY-like chemotaxis protein
MKTILIVEDQFEICENLCELLELEEYDVLTASDGIEGLELAMRHQPDLIVSDIKMPKMDGLTFLHELQKGQRIKKIPVILLSAMAQRRDIEAGLQSGAVAYLTKPFMMEDLLRQIRKVIAVA